MPRDRARTSNIRTSSTGPRRRSTAARSRRDDARVDDVAERRPDQSPQRQLSVAGAVVARLGGACDRGLDLCLGSRSIDPCGAFDGLPGFEVLVYLEEVLDLQLVELGYVVDVLVDVLARVTGRHAQHLVIAAGLVSHAEHADGTAADQTSGEGRFLDEHEGVE